MKYHSHHINAEQNQIADTVIICGDPKRVKLIANKYLENPIQVSDVRDAVIWTGTYKGNKITIATHGMGMSSCAIYVQELIEFYGVKRIIRVGSCLSYKKNITLKSTIISTTAYTDSSIGKGWGYSSNKCNASQSLINNYKKVSLEKGIKFTEGSTYTSLWFYSPEMMFQGVEENSEIHNYIMNGEIIAKSMEAYIIYVIADYFNIEAMTLLTPIAYWDVQRNMLGRQTKDPTKAAENAIGPLEILLESLFLED